MLFTISGKHTDIPEAVKSYAKEKTEKLPKFYDVINQIEVVVDGKEGSKEAGNIAVEIILLLSFFWMVLDTSLLFMIARK